MKASRLGPPPSRPVAAAAAILLVALSGGAARAERLSIRTFSAADGLGSSFVSHVMEDSAGYLWFSTRDGLSRWNGYELTTLTQAAGFQVPAIDRVYQLRSGEYFVVCNDGSLYSYSPPKPGDAIGQGRVTFRRRHIQANGKDVQFTRVYEDDRGVLWGGGQGVLIKRLGTRNEVILLNREGPRPYATTGVRDLLSDRAGSLWIATNHGLFRLGTDGSLSRYPLDRGGADDVVNALAFDRDGRLWIGHGRLGVVVFNPGPVAGARPSLSLGAVPAKGQTIRLAPRAGEAKVLSTANGLPDDSVFSLLAASDGQMWVGTGNGLARFDGTSFTRYTTANGLHDNLVHALLEDGDGNLWAATPTGAMRLELGGVAGFAVDDGLSSARIAAIDETSAGRVCAIGTDWSVSVFDGQRFRASRLSLPAGSSLMWASQVAYRDREGRWWGLTNQGLYRFGRARGDGAPGPAAADRVYSVGDGLPSPHVFRVYQDRAGALWVGTRSGDPNDDGLARLEPATGQVTSFGPADSLQGVSAPSAFAEDGHGNLWVGFYKGGLARYRDGRFQLFTARDGIPRGYVTSLLVDRAGRLWMSTNLEGIGRLDDPSGDHPAVKVYQARDGLASNNARALVEDRAGRVFVGTARGVDRLDPATGRVRHYGADDGLLTDYVTAAFCDSRGDLWFGTWGGVFRLVPRPDREEEPPPIVVTGLRIAGESHPIAELGQASVEDVVLAAGQRDIAVDFVSVSRRHAQGVTYQYSLETSHDSWSAPTGARTLNFARLSPGRYRVAIRAVTAGGTASRVPAVVAFTVQRPLWQRWYVVLLAAAVLAGLVIAFVRYRVARLLEMERLRLAIASDLHDEVATNLGSIAMFSTIVQGELREPAPLLERITVLATESVEAIREIIWSVDPKPETIAGVLVRLHDSLVASCRARGIHLLVPAPPDGMAQNLTPEQRKNVWLMLKEAVTNAVRHSGASQVIVSAAPAGRTVRLAVRDNGVGFRPSDESPGRGLKTMRARAETLGGRLSVSSAPGEGTTVEFFVPLPG